MSNLDVRLTRLEDAAAAQDGADDIAIVSWRRLSDGALLYNGKAYAAREELLADAARGRRVVIVVGETTWEPN